jgi:hypothetical protein
MGDVNADTWVVLIANTIIGTNHQFDDPTHVARVPATIEVSYAGRAKKRRRGVRVVIPRLVCEDAHWRALLDMRMKMFHAHMCRLKEAVKSPSHLADAAVQRVHHYLMAAANTVSVLRGVLIVFNVCYIGGLYGDRLCFIL